MNKSLIGLCIKNLALLVQFAELLHGAPQEDDILAKHVRVRGLRAHAE